MDDPNPSSQPALDLGAQMESAVEELIALYKQRTAARPFSYDDVWTVCITGTGSLVRIAESFAGFESAAKRDAVMAALAKFYDDVIAPLSIPGVPGVLEHWVIDPMLRMLFLKCGAGAIEACVVMYNRLGWNDTPNQPLSDVAPVAESAFLPKPLNEVAPEAAAHG